MRIAVLGGTGPAGRALAVRLASVGYDVVVGSRSRERALEIRDSIVADWPSHDLSIEGDDNAAAAAADVIVVATPWDAASTVTASVAAQLEGKCVISMANALVRIDDEFQPLIPPRGSVAAAVQAAAPGALVAAALHHVPAKELGAIDDPVDSDVLICSDHPSATEITTAIIDKVPGCRALDAGALSNATAIEAFTAVLLQLNVRYKTRVAVKVTGIDLPGIGAVA